MREATTTMEKSKTASKEATGEPSPSHLIDARIAALADWRGETLARVRALIREADPEVVEEVKWRKPSNAMLGVPVWSHAGIVCTGETYKAVVKLTFAKGASLEDPAGLFNASLEGNVRRAIDLREGDRIDAEALKALVRAAVALNTSARATARPSAPGRGQGALEQPARRHRQRIGRVAQHGGAGGGELLGAAVAPGHADGGNAVPGGGVHVELAIADHDRGLRPHILAGDHVRDQVGLVVVGAVELRAADGSEMAGEAQALQDRPGVAVRLGGGHEQAVAAGAQRLERLGSRRRRRWRRTWRR